MMKRLVVLMAVLTLVGAADVAFGYLLNNGDLEINSGEGSMPDGWSGVALTPSDWDIIDFGITLSDSQSGSASMRMDLSASSDRVIFLQELPLLEPYGAPWWGYTFSGYIKGTATGGSSFGVDMFAPDRSGWWWGDGVDIAGTYTDWTYFEYYLSPITNVAWDVSVIGGAGSDFLVDNLSFTELIPEPATFSLIAVAGGALLFVRRRISRF